MSESQIQELSQGPSGGDEIELPVTVPVVETIKTEYKVVVQGEGNLTAQIEYDFKTTPDGTVVKRWIGAAPKKSEQIRELLEKMLAGEPLTEEHAEDGHTH